MGSTTVRPDGASIRPFSSDLLRAAFTATTMNILIMTSTTGVAVTITMLTSIMVAASILVAISGVAVAATSGTIAAAISDTTVAVSSRTTMAGISGTVSDTAAPLMEWKLACTGAAEAVSMAVGVSMVAVAEAFTAAEAGDPTVEVVAAVAIAKT